MKITGLVVMIAAGLSGAIGLWVLIGWTSHNIGLVRVLPVLRLMEFNTALAFLLCGLGLMATVLGWKRLPMPLGGMTGAIGLLTLVQYALGIDLGIDQFFIEDTMSPETPTPGRMAPYTAFSFLFVGSTLFLIGSPFGRTLNGSVPGILGSTIACLGMVALLGALTGVEADYVWAEVIQMERHTAVGFITIGFGIIGFAWRMGIMRGEKILDWSPVLVFICLEFIVLFLWQGLIIEESKVVKGKMESLAMAVRKEITSEIESRVLALVRMVKRWELQGRPPQAVWESDVSLYMKHQPGYRAIEWVDPSLRVRWIVPQEENESTQFLDRKLDPEHKVALGRIRNQRNETASQSIHVVLEKEGFLVYVPIFLEEDHDGFILGDFNSQRLFRIIFPERALSGYFMALSDGAGGIVGRAPGPEYAKKWAGKTEVKLYDTSWELMLWPNQKFLAKWGSFIPEMTLGVGTLITLLLTLRVCRIRTTEKLNHSNQETSRFLDQLQQGQGHLIQLEKMASIGGIIAGIVNEINNSIAYLRSNLGVLSDYVEDIRRLFSEYNAVLSLIEQGQMEEAKTEIKRIRNTPKAIDFRFSTEDLRSVIQESIEGVEQVDQIIRNLSDYSQGGGLNHKSFNLNHGLENTLKLVWNELKHKAEVEKELGSIPEILCCPQELNQVFMNLLINAAEAIPNKGKIWVRTYRKKDRIIVEVEDTGIGIIPENLGRVFDPFFTTKSDIKRTGLGLWVSKEIIKKHGGEIEVASVLGKRTKFLVDLPMTKQEEGQTETIFHL